MINAMIWQNDKPLLPKLRQFPTWKAAQAFYLKKCNSDLPMYWERRNGAFWYGDGNTVLVTQ